MATHDKAGKGVCKKCGGHGWVTEPGPEYNLPNKIMCDECGGRGTHAKAGYRGQTVWAWIDWFYYDGVLAFAQGCKTGDWPVEWCGLLLPTVGTTNAR